MSLPVLMLTVYPVTLLGLCWALLTCLRLCQVFILDFFCLVTRRAICCHVLSPSASQGSQSWEQQPLNPAFGKSSEPPVRVEELLSAEAMVLHCFSFFVGKHCRWSLKCNNYFSKAEGREEEKLLLPPLIPPWVESVIFVYKTYAYPFLFLKILLGSSM